MNPKLKSILAVVAGMAAAFIVIILMEMLSPFKPSEGLDFKDPAVLATYMKQQPTTAFIYLLVTYFLAALVGGAITNWVARGTKYRPALVTGFGLFVAGVANLIAIPHPLWFSIISSLLYFVGAWVGGKLARKEEYKTA